MNMLRYSTKIFYNFKLFPPNYYAMSKEPEGKKVPVVKREENTSSTAEVPRNNTEVKIDDPEDMEKVDDE